MAKEIKKTLKKTSKKVSKSSNKSKQLLQLTVKNARENNLKNISLTIPRYSFVVITGVSGSGKSSLAYNTLFNEGQRRYVASLSSYARQFIPSADPADVDRVEGLSPTISITQKSTSRNPRSTVGTVTRVYDFLRLWYARLGSSFCSKGHGEISSKSKEVVVKNTLKNFLDKTLLIMAPVVIDRKGEYRKEIEHYTKQGFSRLLIDGKMYRSEDVVDLARYEKHTIEVVCDRLKITEENYVRLSESIERATDMTDGCFSLLDYEKLCRDEKLKRYKYKNEKEYQLIYVKSICQVCGESAPELEPKIFSFNSPQDACTDCAGIGLMPQFNIDTLIKDPEKSVYEGGLSLFKENGNVVFVREGKRELAQLFKKYKINPNTASGDLPKSFLKRLFNGEGKEKDDIPFWVMQFFLRYIREGMSLFKKNVIYTKCSSCNGSGLKLAARNVFYRGFSIDQLGDKTIKDLLDYFRDVKKQGINEASELLWQPIYTEIVERLVLLDRIGLGYLTLSRKANTLSGGEAQRLRLASQIGSGLEECLYVLDEPSIGLHALDNNKLIETLKLLRDRNNTLVVIEHDEDTMLSADYLVEIGPEAGDDGGHLLFAGHPSKLKESMKSGRGIPSTITFDYLLGKRRINPENLYVLSDREKRIIEANDKKTDNKKKDFVLKNLSRYNIDHLDLTLPLGKITVLTGVSGSGKSTLMELIYEKVLADFNKVQKNRRDSVAAKKTSTENPISVVNIDQKPIGRTPRSNPATYTKVWDHIRDLFAQMPESKLRGFNKGRFSFNVKGGRCEECGGAGIIELDMHMFSSVEVPCEGCDGKRFNSNTLKVEFNGKNIYEILEMTVRTAVDFFSAFSKISHILRILSDVGLGYMKLGQPSTTLSGGEAQRIKLARELARDPRGERLYLFDEPTTGLHFEDIRKLLGALKRLSFYGHTVVVVEHNMEVIKSADHIVELGPGSGKDGGKIIFSGTAEQLAKNKKNTPTGKAMFQYNAREKKRIEGFFLKSKNLSQLLPQSNQKQNLVRRDNFVEIRGLKTNNLKNISLDIPKNKLVVFTGVSGSGKTSLLFDSIFVEGQRRYVESLSTYARRFLDQFPKVDADRMDNLSPTICIDREHFSRNPRSLIATQTELYDRFRLLYANVGKPHCPYCYGELRSYSEREVADDLLQKNEKGMMLIAAPVYLDHFVRGVDEDFRFATILLPCQKKSELPQKLEFFLQEGYKRVIVDKKLVKLEEIVGKKSILKKVSQVFLVLDRVTAKTSEKNRMIETIENSYRLSKNTVAVFDGESLDLSKCYARFPMCYEHAYCISEVVTPRDFSFNHHQAACSHCDGIGFSKTFVAEKFLINRQLPVWKGAFSKEFHDFFKTEDQVKLKLFQQAREIGWDLANDNRPYICLTMDELDFLYYGMGEWEGFYWWMGKVFNDEGFSSYKRKWRLKRLHGEGACGFCRGGRVKLDMQTYTVAKKNIAQATRMKTEDALSFFSSLLSKLNLREKKIATDIVDDVVYRLSHMVKLGLDYLTLDRQMHTLSGGERQRVRLSTQLGSKLSGVMYILDEPTVGLHERDTHKLLDVVQSLRALENSVFLIEHCSVMMRNADYIVDIGPDAGESGGTIVYSGENKKSQLKETSFYNYLYQSGVKNQNDAKKNAGKKSTEKKFSYERKNPLSFDKKKDGYFHLKNIYKNNLYNQSAVIPINRLVGISGVSGSGKSSLIEWIQEQFDFLKGEFSFTEDFAIQEKLETKTGGKNDLSVSFFNVEKGETSNYFEHCIVVDQSPISTNSRSVIATYMGFYDEIREVFSNTSLAKERGYHKGYFSFNTSHGVCQECSGLGERKVEMHFISDIVLPCDACRGKRFRPEILEVYHQGKNMSDILKMTVREAVEFFYPFSVIRKKMAGLVEVGLEYLRLGFPLKILSSGERQRLKIAHQLAFENPEKSLYILDEPTTGLHFRDVQKLVCSLDTLLEKGASIVVVEHNIEFLRSVDYLIDLGPEGGDRGGEILCGGSVYQVCQQMKKEKKGFSYLYL